MKSVDLLLENPPSWTEIEHREKGGAKIVASPPMPGSGSTRKFYLELSASRQHGVSVTEQIARRQFPAFCLERHINPDNTFCLFFGSEEKLENVEATVDWWSGLGNFLLNQIYADRRAVWPLAAGLSHGEAAREQLKMEVLAEPLGWKDDVLLAMFRGKGWLAERLPRISKSGDRVSNSRSPCPRGCTRKHKLLRKNSCDSVACYPDCQKKHNPILRTDCPNRAVINSLILHEHLRRKIESQIVDALTIDGKKCCGTMKFCSLRNSEDLQGLL